MKPDLIGAAFFDVDGTILPGTSTEILLARALLKRRLPGRFRWRPFLFEAVRLLPKGPTAMRKANKAYLCGSRPEDLRAWGERIFDADVKPRLDSIGRGWIERERAAGRMIVLLSGMPELLLETYGRRLEADLVIGTPLRVDERGVLTGRRAGLHPYGEVKLDIARALVAEHGWEPSACSAYGDHASDARLLSWVGFPHAIDPDPALRRLAVERGWPIIDRAPGAR